MLEVVANQQLRLKDLERQLKLMESERGMVATNDSCVITVLHVGT